MATGNRIPGVSVILPTYNHARYLAEALRSVLQQDYTGWEAIVVDDGSTDDTAEVVAQFTDPRIRYVFQENRGLSAARNTGIGLARAELIALLDADDEWEPTFLATMVGVLDADPAAGAAYCGFHYMDATGALLGQSVNRVVAPERFREELLFRGNWLCPCSVVARGSAYSGTGSFDEALRACEDLDMWLRMSERHPFVGVPETLVRYRRSGSNMSDDTDRMGTAFASLIAKHLGPIEGSPATWDESKRAVVGSLHRRLAHGYLSQGRAGDAADSLCWLLSHEPGKTGGGAIWRSLACVHQPVGQRGEVDCWVPERGEDDVLTLLSELERRGMRPGRRRRLRSAAHLALAGLCFQKHLRPRSGGHLIQSARYAPWRMFTRRWAGLALRLLLDTQWLRKPSRELDQSL